MKRLVLLALFVFAAQSVAAELPPAVREAVRLELEGRLGEALDRYRAALSTVPALVQDEDVSDPLTILVLSKSAHLSIDLGFGEEAWDLSSKLLTGRSREAAEAGTLVRLRLLRLQQRRSEAVPALAAYMTMWEAPWPPSILNESQRLKQPLPRAELMIRQAGGPASWVLAGTASLLPTPTDAWTLTLQEAVRLQVGAFKEWTNALTMVDMLREKGWVPFTDVKKGPSGEKLHVVYIVSRQAAADRARLEAQGLTSAP